jgi:hypothetical protein
MVNESAVTSGMIRDLSPRNGQSPMSGALIRGEEKGRFSQVRIFYGGEYSFRWKGMKIHPRKTTFFLANGVG